ncbi:hypothetical protein JCM8202v2_005018 [Rhodotorula sphaerocarpa]
MASSSEPEEASATRKRARTRITQACRRCKARRARCDGVLPSCGTCVKHGVACEYPGPDEDGRKSRRTARALTAEVAQPHARANSTTTASATLPRAFAPTSTSSPDGLPRQLPQQLLPTSAPLDLPQHPPGLPASASPDQPPSAPPATTSDSGFSAVRILADAALPSHIPNDIFAPYGVFTSHLTAAQEPLAADGSAASAPPGGHCPRSPSPPAEGAATPIPKLSYLRPFGPSGIQPGLEAIVISIAAPPTSSRDHPSVPAPLAPSGLPLSFSGFDPTAALPDPQHLSSAPISRVHRFFDEGSDMPRADVKRELLNVFFDRLGSLFPFLDRRAVMQLEGRDSPSAVDVPLLINSICAVAARFSDFAAVGGPDPGQSPSLRGVPFADKAKAMLVALLGYPTTRTVQSILLLSWHEFSLNNDGSFWAFAGMGLRMAQDLGLHLDIERANLDPYARAIDRLTWWAVMAHDRMLSLGTGRPVTIKSHEISTPLPTDEEIRIVTGSDSAFPSAFPTYCALMLLFGDLCDIVNCVKGEWKMPSDPGPSTAAGLKESSDAARPPAHELETAQSIEPLEEKIARVYADLPAPLRWSSINFRRHHDAGNGPIFLHLHLWYHCVLIMLYSPPLIYPRTKAARMSLADRLSVVTRSSLQISQIIGVAELVGDRPDYEAAPFVNQTFFVAASAWIKDQHIRTGQGVLAKSQSAAAQMTPLDLLAQSAADNFALCQNALSQQERYWLGCGWLRALVSRRAGQSSPTSIKAATAQLSTFVSEHELAVFRRLAKRIGGEAKTPEMDEEDTFASTFQDAGQLPNV